ncbi:conserved hypothetical protein (plasmid) [Rhodococcus jostii RHA1]|jgi:predicted TIM-barrel fold metal-dependent hydrolase|uniref:Amidohydrolase-related domain-containing protein n=1 Tax=Rhodococcus jostii (strain RHA1) TaxID=101510 RepID=Q0RW58_RHOJR|nr:amidohydrolase family protein [Rhodococcus jostii]ABH00478.1 conserved hypothetical protein [Rhodococcus jostii RHA1]
MTENALVIDTCITPFWRTELEPHSWMPEPWASKRHLPGILRQMYSAPTGIAPYGEYRDAARPADDAAALPGSSIEKVVAKLDADGARLGVLVPLTRGPQPDQDMSTVLCAATNDWLAQTWLGDEAAAGRFLGTIRVNPGDPTAAVAEIERWGDDPRFVQVGVPLEAQRPYGQRNYFPIWEAAARHRLPVVVHADGGATAGFKPTIAGYPHKHIDYASQESVSGLYHLASFILEGTLERLPDLRVVFGDGVHDLLMPFIWRMDADFAISRHEVPWVPKETVEYLDRFRFRTSRLEGPEEANPAWLRLSRAAELLVYGSNYPHWTSGSPNELPLGLEGEARERVLWRNAADLIRPRLERVGRTELVPAAAGADS